jgi:hypothetical protein
VAALSRVRRHDPPIGHSRRADRFLAGFSSQTLSRHPLQL